MSRRFGTSALRSLSTTTYGTSSDKYTLFAWVYAYTKTEWGSIAKNWLSGSTIGQFHFGFHASAQTISNYLTQSDGVFKGPVQDTTDLVLNKWNAVLTMADGSDLRLFMNGLEVGTPVSYDGTLKTNYTLTHIGSKTTSQYWDGLLAEVAYWRTDLTSQEIMALALGTRPLVIKPGDLGFYYPIKGYSAPEPDLSMFGNHAFINGSNNIGPAPREHPPLLREARKPFYLPKMVIPPGAAPSGRIMSSMANYGGLAGPGGIAGRYGGLAG